MSEKVCVAIWQVDICRQFYHSRAGFMGREKMFQGRIGQVILLKVKFFCKTIGEVTKQRIYSIYGTTSRNVSTRRHAATRVVVSERSQGSLLAYAHR